MEANKRPANHIGRATVQWRADAAADPRQWAVGWARYYPLLLELTNRNVKTRYVQSVLGLYWVFINPLVTTAVLTVVFSLFVRVPVEDAPYFLFVLTGLLGWNFFANTLSDTTQSLLLYSSLLGKVPFPREVLPTASVAARVVDFAASAVVLLALVAVFFPQGLSPASLWLPVLLAVQLLLALGVGFLVSMANLFYRDVQQLVQLLLTLGFFLTPLIYPKSLVPEKYQAFFLLNPVAVIIEGYRSVLLFHESPDWPPIAVSAVMSVVVFVIGYWAFKRWEPLFAERV